METSRRYAWADRATWQGRLLLGSIAAVGVLLLLVSGIALLAQATADEIMPMLHYSVPKHAVAMTAVAALTVAVAVGLVRLGQQLLAGVVIVAAAMGPMTLVAAPVRASMAERSLNDTVLWWHVTVAAVLVAVTVAWVWWVNRCLSDGLGQPSRTESWLVVRQVAGAAVFAIVAVLSIQAYSMIPAQSNEPVMRAVVGWGVLAAGIVVVTAFARTAWPAAAFFVGIAAMLGLMFLAYSRSGGWPGVAGWELNGMQSPIVTSVASTGTLLLAPVLGAIGWALRVASRSARAHLGAPPAGAVTG